MTIGSDHHVGLMQCGIGREFLLHGVLRVFEYHDCFFILHTMLGAWSAGKPKTSSSSGIDDRVANVFRQGGGCSGQGSRHGGVWLRSFSYIKMHRNSVPG